MPHSPAGHGIAYDVAINLAANLTASLIEKGAGRLRDLAFGDAETRALRRAWEAAFETMLTEVAADRDKATLASLEDIFTAFIRADGVADLLLDLALSDGEPPLTELAARFEAQGFDRETLPVDFRAALEALTRGLSDALTEEAEEPGSPLYNRVSLGRLFVLQALLLRERETLEAITAILRRLETQGGRTIYNIIIQQARGIAIGDGAQVLTGLDNDLREATMEAVLRAYRTHLRRTYAELNLRGLALSLVNGEPLDPKLVHIPLDRVYIKLRARPREKQERPQDEQSLAEHIHKLHAQRREWEEEARRAEAIAPEEAVRKHTQLVILGPPGAGKSTFLQHLAWARAEDERIPLLVPLGRLDAALGGGHRLLDAALDFLTGNELKGNLLREALEQAIAEGKVLWLWDALDEVRTHRREVIADLEALAAKGYPMVITSRPMGYAPITGLEAVYDVLPLQAEEARAFVGRWFRALAEAKGKDWADERQQWMERQLDERPGLREVARNPLMLTFLAMLAGDDPRRDFPRHRKELYARFIERLITSWEAWKRGGEEVPLLSGFDDPDEAREIALFGFRRIAWHLHLAYTGEVAQATHKVMKEALAKDLQAELDIRRLRARGLAEKLLDFWQRAGLLDTYTLRGVDYLAFRHLTFQEYGAARALAETYGDDPEALWAVLEPRLLEEAWAEVIPLTLAHLENATPLVERLLEANIEDEDQQRLLFRAAVALADGTDVAEAVRRQVIDGLAHLARTRDWWAWGERASAEDAITALGRLESENYAAKVLIALARNKAMDGRVRVQAAEALGKLGRVEQAAELLRALVGQDGVDKWNCARAITALRRLGRAEELLALAQDRAAEAEMRMRAVEAVSRLGHVGKAAEQLIALAQDRAIEIGRRIGAAEALGMLGRIEDAVEQLLALAQDWAVEAEVRARVAEALGEMSRVGDAAQVWLTLAQDGAAQAGMRVEAAEVLVELGCIEEAAQAWLAIARDGGMDIDDRVRAVETLGRLGCVGELLALAEDRAVDARARVRATEALVDLDRVEEASHAWLAIAQDGTVRAKVRMRAAKALMELGSVEELRTLARNGTVDAWRRVRAAEALGRLGRVEDAAFLLLALAQDGTVDARTRVRAAEALGKLGRVEDAAFLLLALAQDRTVDARTRVRAASTLGRLGFVEEAVPILRALVQDVAIRAKVRVRSAEALVRMDHVGEAIPILRAIAQDEAVRAGTRMKAAKTLGRLGCAEEAAELLFALAHDGAVEGRTRVEAAKALGRLGRVEKATELLLALAQDWVVDSDDRVWAADMLGEFGRVEEAVSILRAIARDRKVAWLTRNQAANVLRRWQDKL